MATTPPNVTAQCFHARAEMTVRIGQLRAVNSMASLPELSPERGSGSSMPEVLAVAGSNPSDSTAKRRRRRSPARTDPAKPFT